MDYVLMLCVICHEVILLVIPHKCPRTQRPGADLVYLAAVSWNKLLVRTPGAIFEAYALPLEYSPVNGIHVVINALVHGLYAAA